MYFEASVHTGLTVCVVGTHVFVLTGEMWSRGLVYGHDHYHHVFTVEDGCSQNVLGLVLCEFINK